METTIVNFKEICKTNNFRLTPLYYITIKKFNIKGCIPISELVESSSDISSGLYIDTYVEKGLKFIRVKDIKKYSINISEIKYVSHNAPERAKIKYGDIIYPRTQNIDKMGMFCLCGKKLDGSAISQHIARINLKKNINSYYVCAYLNSKFGKSQMSLASSTDGRSELTNYQTSQIKILFFNDIEKQITANTQEIIRINEENECLINKVNKIIDVFLESLLSKKIENEKITKNLIVGNDIWIPRCYGEKEVRLFNTIKNSCKYKKISELINRIYKGIEPGHEKYILEMQKKDEKPFIRTSDIYNNEIDFNPDYFVSNNLFTIKKDSIIYSKDGKIGQTAIITKNNNVVIGSGFAILELNKVLPLNYIFAILQHNKIIPYQANMKTIIGATIPHLKENEIKKFVIPIIEDKIQEISCLIEKWKNNVSYKNELIHTNDVLFNKKYNEIFGI